MTMIIIIIINILYLPRLPPCFSFPRLSPVGRGRAAAAAAAGGADDIDGHGRERAGEVLVFVLVVVRR